jgi:4-amino-4-deoxy-L-arabinose transferase-like glycosyltransferase
LHGAILLAAGAASIAMLKWFRRVPLTDPVKAPLGKAWVAAAAVFGAYGVWYFVNALAPETSPDGITYHLGLPAAYLRLGGFPGRITFFDLVPQGMEMLFTVAFALGRHSAAKLVEFGFFIATLPLILRMGRRLGVGDLGSLVAAVAYFCAPVAGLTGSSSYNDAALVFFTLAAFYLLLVWRDTDDPRYLVPAGLLAGFCYAIKFPGILAVAAAVLFVLTARRFKLAATVAAFAAIAMAPWIVRSAVLTGSPVAPLMNGLFPNPWFHLATEQSLAADLRSLGPVSPAQVPWELAFGDRLTGTFGPLLLLLPVGLLSLRWRSGRLCWAAAAVLAIPWFSNSGARFLMPSMAFAALALGMALPRPAAWAAIALQAVLCWPQAIETRETRYAFRLHEFPWRAALRMEPEPQYIKRFVNEYNVAKMVERATPPGARTLALTPVAGAYLDRDVLETWQSAEGDRLLDSLRMAAIHGREPVYGWTATWPMQLLGRLRFRAPASVESEWDATEVELYSGDDRVFVGPQCTLRAWPNPWEAPFALDINLATRWRMWGPTRAGAYLEIDLDRPQLLSRAVVVTHARVYEIQPEFYGRAMDAKWRLLSRQVAGIERPRADLRLEATRALRLAGYRYVLAPTGEGGNAPIGNALAAEPLEWGLELAGDAGRFLLFRLK